MINIQSTLTKGVAKIIAIIIKSNWSRKGTGWPLSILSLLFKKLPKASPTNAPKPNKNPINIPLAKLLAFPKDSYRMASDFGP